MTAICRFFIGVEMKFILQIQFFGRGGSKAGGGGGTVGGSGAVSGGASDTEPTVTAAPEGTPDEAKGAFDPSTASLDDLYAQDYHTFKDKAAYSHGYEGSGKEVVDFFNENSNYDELIDGMNDRQREAFRRWTEGYFMDGAQYKGWDGMSTTEHHYTSRMDHILDQAVLNEGIVVTRRASAELVLGAGTRKGSLEALQAMEGRSVFSRGAMSTGAASQGLTIGDSSKNVEYKIHIPKGSKGAGMWVGDRRINGWGAEQREFVVNRDSTFKVGKTRYNPSRKIYEVDVFYTGQMEHDYGTSKRK